MNPLWNQKGKFWGWRIGDQLFTHQGFHIGQFPTMVNTMMVNDLRGYYLGIQLDNRLISETSFIGIQVGQPFIPIPGRIPLGLPLHDIEAYPKLNGFQEFPNWTQFHHYQDDSNKIKKRVVSPIRIYKLFAFIGSFMKTN